MSTNNGIINVFVPGVKRGEEVSEYARKMGYGEKKYFFVIIRNKDGKCLFVRVVLFTSKGNHLTHLNLLL
jgi:hypothetical protein